MYAKCIYTALDSVGRGGKQEGMRGNGVRIDGCKRKRKKLQVVERGIEEREAPREVRTRRSGRKKDRMISIKQ